MSGLAKIKGMEALIRKLHATPAQVKKVGDDMVKKHARALISSSGNNGGLMQIVPPASMDRKVFGTRARKQGEGAVMRDIYRVYGTPRHVYDQIKAINRGVAAGYWQAIKRKDYKAANGLARRLGCPEVHDFTTDDGAEHKRRREGGGRVIGKKKSFFVTDGRYVLAYLKRKQKNVGMMGAALQILYNGKYGPLKAVPSWMSRHKGSWAGGSMSEFHKASRGLIIRVVFNAQSLSSELQPFFKSALRWRLHLITKEAPYALRGYMKSLKL